VAEKGLNKPFTDLGLQPNTIVTKDFFEILNKRYQGKQICWVGDIGDSLYKTHEYMIETLEDMVKVGMDLEKEDFSIWNKEVRSKKFLEKLKKRKPEIYNLVTQYLRSVSSIS